ncbi:hypothetical protein K491DRAFT_553538, partial [Lophiostoma macrostomum CBS 122681]
LLSLLLPVLCYARPNADPEAQPEPDAAAEPQTYQNNFSGAIYIVYPDGQAVAAGTNMCPNTASGSCSNAGYPSWCCPASYSCAAPQGSNGLIGCCPNGNTCGGAVNVASVTTITVQAVQPTSVVYVAPTTSLVVVGQATSAVQYQGGFCSTLTASGPGLPTTRQGACGVILVVNQGPFNFKALGYGTGAILFGLHLALRRMF